MMISVSLILLLLSFTAFSQESELKNILSECQRISSDSPDSAFKMALYVQTREGEIEDANLRLKLYNELAMNANLIGLYTRAATYCLESNKLIEFAKDSAAIGNSYLIQGHVKNNMGQHELALEDYSKAILNFSKSDSIGLSYAYSGKGIAYHDLGQFELALKTYLKADSIWSEGDVDLHADLYNNLGAVLTDLGKLEQARWYYIKALAIYEEQDWKSSRSMMHYNLGDLHVLQGNYTEAEKEFYKSLKIGYEIESLEEIKWAYFGLYELEKSLGSKEKALQYHEKYHQFSDSLKDLSSLKEIDNLAKVYEQERTAKENLRLEAEAVALKLENSTRSKNEAQLWTGLIALLVIVVGGTVVIVRMRKINNLLKEQRRDIIEKNKTIDHALAEKELLLKEIHHRVKNNLQIISSLLSLQKNSVEDELAGAFQESQSRIQAIALIHQKLYQSTNIATVNFEDYLRDLANQQQSLYYIGSANVTFHVETDNIELDLDTAVPLGLIVAELIANSFKHAFLDHKSDRIINLRLEKTENYRMVVSDNGKGLPEDFDPQNLNSLGMEIVFALVEQISGKISYANRESGGTQWTIEF